MRKYAIWLINFVGIQTKVTLESFLAWKKRKILEKKDQLAKEEDQKRKDYKSGKQFGLSGREMFSFNPSLATDNDLEDDDGAYASYEREDDDDMENVTEYKELDLDALAAGAQEVSSYIHFIHDIWNVLFVQKTNKSCTLVTHVIPIQADNTGTIAAPDRLVGHEEEAKAAEQGDVVDATPFNEKLFLDEEALDGLEDELNDLDLNDDS